MLYRGEQLDSGLGFYYLRARWFTPAMGRFISADKYEGDATISCCHPAPVEAVELGLGWAFAHHLFAYSYHDPVNFIDPSGLSAKEKGVLSQLTKSLEQFVSIERQQRRYRTGADTRRIIDSIIKSKTRLKNALKKAAREAPDLDDLDDLL